MSEKVIGVYPLFNTGGICVHAIDYAEDKVLASVETGKNRNGARWQRNRSQKKMAVKWSRAFCRLFFRAVLRGHAHVNLKREGLHESDC